MNYAYTYFISFSDKYRFNTDKQLINTNTNRVIKKVYNNGCIGYNIDRRFKSRTFIKKNLVRINKLKEREMSDDLKRLLSKL